MANNQNKELGGPRKMSTGAKIVIGIFAVIMAVSMMLPSLTQIFAGSAEQAEKEQAAEQGQQDSQNADAQNQDDQAKTEDQAKTDEQAKADDQAKKDEKIASDEFLARVPDNETFKTTSDTYAKKASTYEKKLVDDPNNLAALLYAGQAYMNWGYSLSYSASTDEEKAFANDIVKKAVEYFDRYLAIEPAKSVKVDRALCKSYMDDTAGAIADLEKLSQEEPTFPLVWANLGMLYQANGESEKATEAYTKAVETDPNDEYGAKGYGEKQLISLNSKVSSPSDAGDAAVESSDSTGSQGLTQTLAQDSGVGF